MLSLANRDQLRRVLGRMLDESEFLSDYGVRALSRYHLNNPYEVDVNGQINRVQYEPAESTTGLFGGNSNWRGPIWFPVNYLLIESLQKFHHYFGEDFKVQCPTGVGPECNLWQVAARDFAAADSHFRARRGRAAAGVGRRRTISERSALERLDHVLRIFQRRQRRGYWRESSNGVDRIGREVNPTKWRVTFKRRQGRTMAAEFDLNSRRRSMSTLFSA